MFTKLKDRTLWYDGDSTVNNMNFLYDKILHGESISNYFIEYITPEVDFYNKNTKHPLTVKSTILPLTFDWNIPDEYKKLPIRKYILTLLETEVNNNSFSDEDIEYRINRVNLELELWKSNNMMALLKAIIFVVDQFRNNNIVWGTGRGSSCCCYILYLIGLHDVDSIHYNLDISEFFRN